MLIFRSIAQYHAHIRNKIATSHVSDDWNAVKRVFKQRGLSLDAIQTDSFSVHFNEENIVDYDAIRKWRDYKNDLLSQFKGAIRHHV